jgi:hypothetical protein
VINAKLSVRYAEMTIRVPLDPHSGRLAALRYVTTTAVPLAVTISIEPFWPTVS